MVAGQSCIAGPSVCHTLYHVRRRCCPSPALLQPGEQKKGACRGRLQEERVCWCLQSLHGLMPWNRSIAGVST
jgi:hypothetical protein